MNSTACTFKQQGHALIEQLPEEAVWKDLAYEVSVLQDIDEALRESDAGLVVDNVVVRQKFGLGGTGT